MTGPKLRVEVATRARPRPAVAWLPLALVLAVVATLVALAPSLPADSVATRARADPSAGVGGDGDPSASDGFDPGDRGPARSGAGAGPGGPASGPAGGRSPGSSRGDRSHCTPDGRQHAITFHAPPCVPRFSGDNGGATAPGVTGEVVKVVTFNYRCDAATEALLTSMGFEFASCEEQAAAQQAAVAHLNRRLELYGRRMELEVVFANCPYPEDLDSCMADARAVIAKRPFAVVPIFLGFYQPVWEELARNGVVVVGAGALADNAYLAHSPYWWSRFMSSTRQADLVGDWWCATMAGGRATHSGATIHSRIGRRGEDVRRAGLIHHESPSAKAAAERLVAALRRCGTAVTTFAYSADLSTLQQQSLAATSKLIADGVTTVLWFDYTAPVYVLPEFTRQGYFPEHISAGGTGTTADSAHRAMDQGQWRHSFGLFPEASVQPVAASEAARVLRDGGLSGRIPPSAEIYYEDLLLLGRLLQSAGPILTPQALRAIESEPRIGGDGSGDAPGRPREGIGFTATDHTGIDDLREIYWDPDAVSAADGQRGAIVSSDGGARRRAGGPWRGPGAVPVTPS